MSPRTTVVDVVETAYRLARRSPGSWVADVVEALAPLLDLGVGVVGYAYDTNLPLREWLSPPVGDARLCAVVTAAFADTPPALNELIHKRAGAITILSELLPGPPASEAGLAPHADALAMVDMFGVNASDPSGRGTYFCAPSRSRLARSDATIARWQQVAAHLAAAGRLRRVLTGAVPDAVLAPDGRVLHAEAHAQASLPALQRATRGVERARSRRADLDALASWQALVDGRWSLIDEVERDGRRVLFVHANPPEVPDPRRLTTLERVIAGYVVMGHSNKLIAYELGVAVSTVALHLHGVAKKLGVRTRVEVVDRILLITTGEAHALQLDGEVVTALVEPRAPVGPAVDTPLTPAELEVARLAARGQSSARIAATRGVAVRTIANQLASIYGKLSIGSRAELAHHLGPHT